jgi:hypothetical protein
VLNACTLWAPPITLSYFRYTEAFQVAPLNRAVVKVAAVNHELAIVFPLTNTPQRIPVLLFGRV